MKIFSLPGLLVLALLASPIAAHAYAYTDLYVFGDSLSDQGNVSLLTGGAIPPGEYTDGTTRGRFTNGKNYVDYLAADLGLSVTPSLLGGTNFAYGGARTNYHVLPNPAALSLLQQRDAYLTSLGGRAADANALYLVWAGANNFADVFSRLRSDPFYNPTADLLGAGSDIAHTIASLAAAGAQHIIAPNIPDLGLVPAVTGGGPRNPAVSSLVANFNLGLEQALQGIELAFPDTEIIRIDAFALLNGLYQDPAGNGFTNNTLGCYSLYVRPGGTTCANSDEYIFWDLDHPTSATHRILATHIARAVPEPASVVLMLAGGGILLLVLRRRARARC